MRRLFVLCTIFVGLVVAFALAGEDGFQTAKRADAVETTTTWMWPTSLGIQASGGVATTATANTPAPCTNCYITRIVPDLVYMNDPDPANHPNGSTANYNNNGAHNVWLHHMVVVDSCNNFINRIFASGNERVTWSLPAGYGYFQGNCFGWAVNYHIHNNSTQTRGVALKLVVTYRTGETLTPVTPVWLDMATDSTSSEYTVPVGYSDMHTGSGGAIAPDWTSTIQGAIVSIGGHVHDYGISVSAQNLRLGDYICTSIGGYGTGSRYLPTGGPGTPGHPAAGNARVLNQLYHEVPGAPDDRYHIQEMTTCSPTPLQSIICVGDVIRLHTQYNSPDFPIFDAMGIITAYVATNLPDANNNGTIDACDSSDTDLDGFSDRVEFFAGTSRTLKCGTDSWPADLDNSGFSDIADISALAGDFGKSVPPVLPRRNIAPDPLDTSIDITDISRMAGFFGKACT